MSVRSLSVEGQVVRFPLERRQPRQLVDLPGLIDRLGYSERFWRYRIAEGLPCHRWGRTLRFDPIEVERWMEERYGKA